jgi:gliding motility-associated-like protein
MVSSYTYAQVPSTQGQEFYISFMQNGYRVCNGSSPYLYEELYCIISSKNACSGTISNPNTGWSTSFSVTANGITTLSIPEAQAYSTTSETIERKGLIVSSTDTVSLYIANEATNSFDASNVLPTASLGDEYIIQCYTPSPSGISNTCSTNVKSAFVIIATENNTVIDIIPTCTTAGNKYPNNTYTITLNKGQTYQVMSRNRGTGGNLSGTVVKARNCKKIAVFNGNILTGVPTSPSNGFDHIFEQTMPTMFWGNKFAITASKTRKVDFYRITASANNTQIRINNTLVATINQYATYEVQILDTSCYLETSKPSAVYLYQTTSEYDNSTDGDPSMVWITPIEQHINEITYGTFTAHNTIYHHYVNIVTATNNVSSITIDNVNVANQFALLEGDSDLSYARIEIQHGTHTIRGSSGFTAYVYGFGNVRGYAYSVGSNAIDLTGNIIVNGVDMLERSMENSKKYCLNDILLFKLDLNYEYDSIFWDLGNGTSIHHTSDSILFSYTIPGLYLINTIIKLAFANCEGNFYDTVQGYINIVEIKDTIEDTTCYGYYERNGFNFNAINDTIVSLKTTNWLGCDSLVTLYLHVLNNLFFKDTIIACQNSDTIWHNMQLPTSNTGTFIFWDSLKTLYYNCDSIHKLTLMVKPVYFFNDTMTVCQNSTINWRNVLLPTSDIGTFTVWANLQTIETGCDSIYELCFTVKPVYFFFDTMTVCWNEVVHWRNRQLQTSISGVFTVWDSLTTIDGCDSLYRLILIVQPFYFFNDTLMVCYNTTANWHNKFLSTSTIGTFIFWDSLKTYYYNCDSIYKLIFIVLPIPELTTISQKDTLCPRTQTPIIDFAGTATYYEWFASGDNIGIPSQIQTGNFGGHTVVNNTQSILSATITVIPKSDYGQVTCIGISGQFTVSVYPDIGVHVLANDSLFCEGSNIRFEVINHSELYNIQWSGPDSFSSSISNPAILNATLKHAGMYIVNAVTHYDCDAVLDTFIIVVIPDVVLDMKDTFFACNSETVIYSNAIYADTYLWNTGDTTVNIVVPSVGKYWVTVNNLRCQASDTTYVVETTIPYFEIQTKGDICQEGSAELYINIDMENLFCEWSTRDTGKCITVFQNGIYGVSVSFMGCTTLQHFSIACPCDLWIPNVFTPNGDRINDDFVPVPNAVLHTFSMSIYDRWGNLIYRTDTYSPWNGTVNGVYAIMGVYSYVIRYSCSSSPDKTRKKQGRISLIR